MLNGTRSVPSQEAVHTVDDQDLVICSDRITYVSLAQGQALRSETDRSKQKDLITVYRNHKEKYYHLSLEQYFYHVFVDSTFKKHGEDKGITWMWCQGKVVDFIRESKDKHVFVKIDSL